MLITSPTAFEDILDTLPHLPPGALGDLQPVRMFLRDQFVEAVYEYLTVDDSERAKFVEEREAEVKEMVEVRDLSNTPTRMFMQRLFSMDDPCRSGLIIVPGSRKLKRFSLSYNARKSMSPV